MQYMLPLDAVDDEFATFRIPAPFVDAHSISELPLTGGPVEVQMDKEEWRGIYESAGEVEVRIRIVSKHTIPAEQALEDACSRVDAIISGMRIRAERDEEAASALRSSADLLEEALKLPPNVEW